MLIIIAIILGAFFSVRKIKQVKTEEENRPFIVKDGLGQELETNSDFSFFSGFGYSFYVNKAYTLELIPNTEIEDFVFTVDGANRQFFAEVRLLEAFDISVHEKSFRIIIPNNTTVKTILERIYPDKTVVLPEDREISDEKLFTLIISEKNGDDRYRVNFSLDMLKVVLPNEVVI